MSNFEEVLAESKTIKGLNERIEFFLIAKNNLLQEQIHTGKSATEAKDHLDYQRYELEIEKIKDLKRSVDNMKINSFPSIPMRTPPETPGLRRLSEIMLERELKKQEVNSKQPGCQGRQRRFSTLRQEVLFYLVTKHNLLTEPDNITRAQLVRNIAVTTGEKESSIDEVLKNKLKTKKYSTVSAKRMADDLRVIYAELKKQRNVGGCRLVKNEVISLGEDVRETKKQ